MIPSVHNAGLHAFLLYIYTYVYSSRQQLLMRGRFLHKLPKRAEIYIEVLRFYNMKKHSLSSKSAPHFAGVATNERYSHLTKFQTECLQQHNILHTKDILFTTKKLYTSMCPQGSIETHLQLIYYIKSLSLSAVAVCPYTYVYILSLVSLVGCSLVMKTAYVYQAGGGSTL